MRNQFFYTRTEGDKKYRSSFNINKVIRSGEIQDGRVIVLLDDIHQRKQEVDIVSRTGKPQGTKNETVTVQSEIFLDADDAIRFYKLTNIEE